MVPLYKLMKDDCFRFNGSTYRVNDFYFEEIWNNQIEEFVLDAYVETIELKTGRKRNFPENLIVKPIDKHTIT